MSSKPQRPPFEIKVAETRDELEACFDIRVEVFHVEQGFSLDDEIDQWEKEAVHILLTTPVSSPPVESTSFLTPWLANLTESVSALLPDSMSSPSAKGSHQETDRVELGTGTKPPTQKPIGTIRYVPSTGKLTRLAIMKEYRQYGFGTVLVEKLEEEAVRAGKDGRAPVQDGQVTIKAHSQIYVIPFYEKLGYTQEGDRFDEDGAPHQKLVKRIPIE